MEQSSLSDRMREFQREYPPRPIDPKDRGSMAVIGMIGTAACGALIGVLATWLLVRGGM